MSLNAVAEAIKKTLETGETTEFTIPAGYEYFGLDITPVGIKVVLRKYRNEGVDEIDLGALTDRPVSYVDFYILSSVRPVITSTEVTVVGRSILVGTQVKHSGKVRVSLQNRRLMFVVI